MGDSPKTVELGKSSGRLTLTPNLPLDQAVVQSFEAILGFALSMVSKVEKDPVGAVHRFRKSLRRARALLRLLRPMLGDVDYDGLVSTLRDLMRPTSEIRDVDVLIGTCRELEADERTAASMANVRAVIEAHQTALVEQGLAASTLNNAVEPLSTLPTVLAEALAAKDDGEQNLSARLLAGFDATWARAQKAGRRAHKKRSDDAIHRWRTRVKEARYQLELLAEPEGGPVENLRSSLGDLAQRLGTVTDLIALRRYVERHASAISGADVELADKMLAELIRGRFARVGSETYEVGERIAVLVGR